MMGYHWKVLVVREQGHVEAAATLREGDGYFVGVFAVGAMEQRGDEDVVLERRWRRRSLFLGINVCLTYLTRLARLRESDGE